MRPINPRIHNTRLIEMRHLMLWRLYLLMLPALAACGAEKADDRPPAAAPARLEATAQAYLDLLPEVAGPAGFIDTDHCDSLQHSALIAAAGAPVDVTAAEVEPGRWLRRPASLPECWAAGESRSTITRDQLLGVYWYAWTVKDARIVHDLWAFGEANKWRMGDGRLSGLDTLMTYNDILLLARLCDALDADCGANHRAWNFFPPMWSGTLQGFERQLEVLRIMLLWEIEGYPSFGAVDRLTRHASEARWNPLFVAALAARGLADPAQVDQRLEAAGYPTDRLPSSADWCSEWLVETEEGSKPCPEEDRKHSGGEVLFMRRLFLHP